MDEAETFAKDRWRYRLHAATLLVGLPGWILTLASSTILMPGARVALLLVFAVLLTVSGVLAVAVKRTMFSNRATESDPHAEGDALMTAGLHTLDLAPSVTNAVAPYAILAVGLAALAGAMVFLLS